MGSMLVSEHLDCRKESELQRQRGSSQRALSQGLVQKMVLYTGEMVNMRKGGWRDLQNGTVFCQ